MADKIFRDPLYDYVAIDRRRDRWLLELLDTPEVQRLRRVHQLGITHLTYPGAEHTRFSHSLGVLHLMQAALDHLERSDRQAVIATGRQVLLAAALLHDVGHGPFSHLFESVLGRDHEWWSVRIIRDGSTGVHQVLQREDPGLPERVADLIDKKSTSPPTWQNALLSSQLDVDRLDYLRRDSLFTGAGYGHFDWYRLLRTIEVRDDESGRPDLVWPEKAAFAIEEYLFARYYMYQNVYLHKTTRGFERLLARTWEIALHERPSDERVALLPQISRFLDADEPEIRAYLAIEEHVILSQIALWADGPHPVLADLARRFLQRDGFALVTIPHGRASDAGFRSDEFRAGLVRVVGDEGFDPAEAYVLEDVVRAKYRRPYFPEKELGEQTAGNAIRVIVEGESRPVEVSRFLPRLASIIIPEFDQPRYYVPKSARESAVQFANAFASSGH